VRQQRRTLLIVGFGRVGAAIAAQARGWRLAGAVCRGPRSAARARRQGLRVFGGDGWPRVDLALLTVPDGVIAETAAQLAAVPPGTLRAAAHVSGATGLEVLAPLRRAGIAVGSLHPFCSIAGAGTPLAGASCAIEGDARARSLLRALARSLGLRPLRRSPRDRPLYHLAASLVASGTGVLAGQAEQLLRRSGVGEADAVRALSAILRSVADNLAAGGARGLLTGPIVRGDAAVVRRQFALLSRDARTRELYRALGLLALERAGEEGRGDQRGRREIAKLLQAAGPSASPRHGGPGR